MISAISWIPKGVLKSVLLELILLSKIFKNLSLVNQVRIRIKMKIKLMEHITTYLPSRIFTWNVMMMTMKGAIYGFIHN